MSFPLYNGFPLGAVLRAAPVFDGALVTTATAVVGDVVNFAIPLNTYSVNANKTLTYANAVLSNTWTRLRLVETGGADRTINIPSSLSLTRGVAILSFTLPANATLEIVLCFTGTGYEIFNEYATPGQIGLPFFLEVACSDETTALTVGTGKVTFRIPYAVRLSVIRGGLTVAQTSGSLVTFDVNYTGATVFTTRPTFDNTERTTVTAATPSVLSVVDFPDDSEMVVDLDQVGDGTAKGLKITLLGIMR